MDVTLRAPRRRARRARRLRWAATFAAFGAAAAFASTQAMAHERATAATELAVACATGVTLDYDLAYTASIGSFALEGLTVRHVEDACEGRVVVVVLSDTEGRPLASGDLTVSAGASVRFDVEVPVDARDVAAVQVLAHL